MIDVKDIEVKARGRWGGILTGIGVPASYLSGKHGPCIFCGGNDRWRWDNKDGNGTYICGQCGAGTALQLVMKFIGIDFKEALEEVNKILGGGIVEKDVVINNKMSVDDVKKMLNNLWTSSHELKGSDHVCKYLHTRGLVMQPNNVRYCEECYESETKTKKKAMIAKIVNKDNIPLAIHRTYLQDVVPAKADDITSNKKITPATDILQGCAVRLFPVKERTVIVCEGIETGIACHQLFSHGVHACTTSALLEKYEPPTGVRKIIICADNDVNFTGQKSAYKLANRLYNKDYIVDVRVPEQTGKDFVDELWRTINKDQ